MIKYIILTILIGSNGFALDLPKQASETLAKWNPEFQAYDIADYSKTIIDLFTQNKQPMIFSADLNSDKLNDFVILGKDKKKSYVVALMAGKKKWIPVEVSAWTEEDALKSEVLNPKTNLKEMSITVYISVAEDGLAETIKPRKAIQVERYLAQPELFEIKNNAAVKLTLKN